MCFANVLGTVTISSVDSSMSGVYTCSASVNNETGTIYVTLDVIHLPIISGVLQAVISNGTAHLPCTVNSNPSAEIEWILPNSTSVTENRLIIFLKMCILCKNQRVKFDQFISWSIWPRPIPD